MAHPFVQFPGAVQVTESRRYAQTYGYRDPGNPPVLILHTVEGRMGRSAIAAHVSPPHLWTDPLPDYRDHFQTIDLARPALALQNTPGGAAETNHRGLCFQVELQLFSDPKKRHTARHVSNLADDDLRWLGEQIAVLDRISRDLDPHNRGIIPTSTTAVPELALGDLGYGTRSAWRLNAAEWYAFGGILGHGHVPDNSHYDPSGEFDMVRLIEHAQAAQLGNGQAPPTHRVLRVGSPHRDAVEAWQIIINRVFGLRLAEDGRFGPLTAEGTREVEGLLGVVVDGVVDQGLADKVAQIDRDQAAKRTPRPFPRVVKAPAPAPAPTPAPTPAPAPPGLARADTSRALELIRSANGDLAGAASILSGAL